MDSLARPLDPLAIRLLALDVDGVLTDGSIMYGPSMELKSFHVADGLGLVVAMRAGLQVAWITGRSSEAVRQRVRELNISLLLEGSANKREGLLAACRRLGVPPESAAYVGDDLNDLPAFGVAGLRVAVANGAEEVRRAADWVTSARGGRGAVREVVERLLREQGRWDEALQAYLASLESGVPCPQ